MKVYQLTSTFTGEILTWGIFSSKELAIEAFKKYLLSLIKF